MRFPRLLTLPLAAAVLSVTSFASPARAASIPGSWESKVDPWVLSTSATGATEFVVFLKDQADVRGADAFATKEAKGQFVFARLRDAAARTQGPLLALLAGRGIEHRPYWVANMIWVKGDASLVEELARRDDVGHVFANPTVHFEEPVEVDLDDRAPDAIEWNVAKVRAPEVWAAGFTGQGVVIGGQDTGYAWAHPALQGKYRGWNGTAADHNYNWHDSIHGCGPNSAPPCGGTTCGLNSAVPCDDQGHGTHTMGTMVGDDGAGNQVGVAPGAKWIGCRNMDRGDGSPASYSECFQWFIAPTNLQNQAPNPTLAPHVISNSWGCPPSEGCTNPDMLRTVVENTRAAGIVVVVSAGNGGPGCSTVADPPAIYGAAFSVGSTTNTANDAISSFSSRGAVTIDGSNRLKPNVVAPGSNIRSSLRTGGYGNMSGTSMASPNVAGVVSLFLSAYPAFRGNVTAVENALMGSAVPRTTTTENCGGIPGTQVPNNTYGYGRVDAWDAIRTLSADVALSSPPWPVVILRGAPHSYTMTITNNGPNTATSVTLNEPWPASVTINSAVASQGTCTTTGNAVACAIGTMLSGASATVTVSITPTVTGTLTSRATVNLLEFDLSLGNNTLDFNTIVEACPIATPVITGAPLSAPPNTPGLTASTTTSPGHNLTWAVAGGTITGGQGTGTVTFTAGPAGTTMRVTVVDSVASCDSAPGRRNVQVHFLDVPPSHFFHNHVNTLARNEITGGCGNGNYCPDVSIPREQMAVFLLVAREGAGYVPPACTAPLFNDVPCSNPFSRWVNEVARRGITGGCGNGNYCPSVPVTRDQMAVFLLLAREGTGYNPPACVTPSFADVPCSNPFARWIEELARRSITGGCGNGNYCPASPNTRGQMAVFIVAAFLLQ
jgi:uncharacterized repeat protein (TIGR01451 family)